jgi:hypothetical protein
MRPNHKESQETDIPTALAAGPLSPNAGGGE